MAVVPVPFLASVPTPLRGAARWKVSRREVGGAGRVLGEPSRRSAALGPSYTSSWLESQPTQTETEAGEARPLAQGHTGAQASRVWRSRKSLRPWSATCIRSNGWAARNQCVLPGRRRCPAPPWSLQSTSVQNKQIPRRKLKILRKVTSQGYLLAQ